MNIKSIKELAPRPSDALQAMLDGLLEQDQRDDFIIAMSTFGNLSIDQQTCYGCAATCTLQKLAGKNLTVKNILGEFERATFLGFDVSEMELFEGVIDSARHGNFLGLLQFYDIWEYPNIPGFYRNMFCLLNENWKVQIPTVERAIRLLKDNGY